MVWFYLEGVANVLSQHRMDACYKWSIACNADRYYKTGRNKYLRYDVTTNEGVACEFVHTKEAFHTHVESRNTDGSIFENHMPDNGAESSRDVRHLNYKNSVNDANEVDSNVDSDDEDDGPPPFIDTSDSDSDSDDDDVTGVKRRRNRFKDINNVA